MEIGWLPILLHKANADIQEGKVGYLMAADFVKTIQKPEILDRSMGDIHVMGNPHIHLNPHNILLVAKELNNRLQKIDPDNAQNYQNNYDNFSKKWKKSIKRWELKAKKLAGLRIVSHHKSFSYLNHWLKINEVAMLEAKPGIAPNASHLNDLLTILRKNPAKLIITSPYDSQRASNWLHKKTGIKQQILPYTVGGNKQSNDLFSLFENSINLMLDSI